MVKFKLQKKPNKKIMDTGNYGCVGESVVNEIMKLKSSNDRFIEKPFYFLKDKEYIYNLPIPCKVLHLNIHFGCGLMNKPVIDEDSLIRVRIDGNTYTVNIIDFFDINGSLHIYSLKPTKELFIKKEVVLSSTINLYCNNFLIEVFAVKIDDDWKEKGFIHWGINYSASYESIRVSRFLPSSQEEKLDNLINELREKKIGLYVHLISPNLEYISYDKNQIAFSSEQLETMIKAFSDIKKKAFDKTKKQEVEEKKQLPFITIKEAIGFIAQEVYDRQSENNNYILTMRNYFYAIRDEIKKRFPNHFYNLTKMKKIALWGDEDSHYNSFRQNIYELMDNDLIQVPNLVSDPRGYLYEPHSDNEIKLGTKQIDEYEVSDKEYQGILYIEKENPLLQLTQAKIGQKYDILMCASKGYAVRAVKTLLKKCSKKEDFKIFCIHDADPDGYMIYQDLVNNLDVEVIDLGLSIIEGIEKGITPEQFSRKKKIPLGLNLTEDEIMLFENQKLRIEISVMSPREFIDWVDQKLAEYLPEKKIPDNETLTSELKPIIENEITQLITNNAIEMETRLKEKVLRELNAEIEKLLKPFKDKEKELLAPLRLNELPLLTKQITERQISEFLEQSYQEKIKEKLAKNPMQSWINTIDTIVSELINTKKQFLMEDLKKEVMNLSGVNF